MDRLSTKIQKWVSFTRKIGIKGRTESNEARQEFLRMLPRTGTL